MRFLLATSLLLFIGCATAQAPAVNVRDGRGYCPICHDWHQDDQMRWPITHEGKIYRFCDPNCRAAFEKNPEKFLKDEKFNPVNATSTTK